MGLGGTLIPTEISHREMTEEEKEMAKKTQEECLRDAEELLHGYNYEPSTFEIVLEALIKSVVPVILLIVLAKIIFS